MQVSLRQWNDFRFVHKCGAVLLTRDWIITAAHCVKDISHHNLQVRIGEYNFMDENEPHSHIDRRISKVVTHANFDTVKIFDKYLLASVRFWSFFNGGRPKPKCKEYYLDPGQN